MSRISPFDPPTLTPRRPAGFLSMDRRTGTHAHPLVLDGRVQRHQQTWRDLRPRLQQARREQLARAVPRILIAAALVVLVARGAWSLL